VFIHVPLKNNVHLPIVGFQYYLKRELFVFYNRNVIINFVISTFNTEFTDNTTFGIKNYLISSLILFTYWHSSKYTRSTQCFSSNIKNTVVQTCTKLWQFCIICNAQQVLQSERFQRSTWKKQLQRSNKQNDTQSLPDTYLIVCNIIICLYLYWKWPD